MVNCINLDIVIKVFFIATIYRFTDSVCVFVPGKIFLSGFFDDIVILLDFVEFEFGSYFDDDMDGAILTFFLWVDEEDEKEEDVFLLVPLLEETNELLLAKSISSSPSVANFFEVDFLRLDMDEFTLSELSS